MAKCEECKVASCRNGDDCWHYKNGYCHYCHCAEEDDEDDDFECPDEREPAECGAVLGHTETSDHGQILCQICSMYIGYDADLDRWYDGDSMPGG